MELCRWIKTEMHWKRKVLSRSSPETAEVFRPRSARKQQPSSSSPEIPPQGVGKSTFCPGLGTTWLFYELLPPWQLITKRHVPGRHVANTCCISASTSALQMVLNLNLLLLFSGGGLPGKVNERNKTTYILLKHGVHYYECALRCVFVIRRSSLKTGTHYSRARSPCVIGLNDRRVRQSVTVVTERCTVVYWVRKQKRRVVKLADG